LKKKKKSAGSLLPIIIIVTGIIAALLTSVLLPDDAKAGAVPVFVCLAGAGAVLFALAAGIQALLRRAHHPAKDSEILAWFGRIGAMLLMAGLIALFYSALMKPTKP
jgi:4-amino-4-deoxy-L-arabinose transferase-like glycosyltransferase